MINCLLNFARFMRNMPRKKAIITYELSNPEKSQTGVKEFMFQIILKKYNREYP